MSDFASYRFETPENVQVRYEAAGLGTRFLAWFVDQFLVWLLTILMFILLVMAGISFDAVFRGFDDGDLQDTQQFFYYAIGIVTLVWGLGSFLYFCMLELLMRGQTIGKRALAIRVVKADGFQLDAASIVLRNAFRVVDQIPLMWMVPFVSRRSQRAGDMVAGTIVVSDARAELSTVRAALAQRGASDFQFRFDQAMLKRVSAQEFTAVERMLDRWPDLNEEQRESLLTAYTAPLARKIQIDPPSAELRLRFLEDLLQAELRRRDRKLV